MGDDENRPPSDRRQELLATVATTEKTTLAGLRERADAAAELATVTKTFPLTADQVAELVAVLDVETDRTFSRPGRATGKQHLAIELCQSILEALSATANTSPTNVEPEAQHLLALLSDPVAPLVSELLSVALDLAAVAPERVAEVADDIRVFLDTGPRRQREYAIATLAVLAFHNPTVVAPSVDQLVDQYRAGPESTRAVAAWALRNLASGRPACLPDDIDRATLRSITPPRPAIHRQKYDRYDFDLVGEQTFGDSFGGADQDLPAADEPVEPELADLAGAAPSMVTRQALQDALRRRLSVRTDATEGSPLNGAAIWKRADRLVASATNDSTTREARHERDTAERAVEELVWCLATADDPDIVNSSAAALLEVGRERPEYLVARLPVVVGALGAQQVSAAANKPHVRDLCAALTPNQSSNHKQGTAADDGVLPLLGTLVCGGLVDLRDVEPLVEAAPTLAGSSELQTAIAVGRQALDAEDDATVGNAIEFLSLVGAAIPDRTTDLVHRIVDLVLTQSPWLLDEKRVGQFVAAIADNDPMEASDVVTGIIDALTASNNRLEAAFLLEAVADAAPHLIGSRVHEINWRDALCDEDLWASVFRTLALLAEAAPWIPMALLDDLVELYRTELAADPPGAPQVGNFEGLVMQMADVDHGPFLLGLADGIGDLLAATDPVVRTNTAAVLGQIVTSLPLVGYRCLPTLVQCATGNLPTVERETTDMTEEYDRRRATEALVETATTYPDAIAAYTDELVELFATSDTELGSRASLLFRTVLARSPDSAREVLEEILAYAARSDDDTVVHDITQVLRALPDDTAVQRHAQLRALLGTHTDHPGLQVTIVELLLSANSTPAELPSIPPRST